MYDYLIVGAGLYGAVCARELKEAGKSVLIIDKRNHVAGNTEHFFKKNPHRRNSSLRPPCNGR